MQNKIFTLTCVVCGGEALEKDTLHFSSNESGHLHVCRHCVELCGLQRLFIDVEACKWTINKIKGKRGFKGVYELCDTEEDCPVKPEHTPYKIWRIDIEACINVLNGRLNNLNILNTLTKLRSNNGKS